MEEGLRPRADTVDSFLAPGLRIALAFEVEAIKGAGIRIVDTMKFFPKPQEWREALVATQRELTRRYSAEGTAEHVTWKEEFCALMGWMAGFELALGDYKWLVPPADPIWSLPVHQRPGVIPHRYMERRLSDASEPAVAMLLRVVAEAKDDSLPLAKLDQAAADLRRALTDDSRKRISHLKPSERIALVERRADAIRSERRRAGT